MHDRVSYGCTSGKAVHKINENCTKVKGLCTNSFVLYLHTIKLIVNTDRKVAKYIL